MKLKINKLVRSVGATIVKYSPEILTGLAVTGSVVAVATAIKNTPKAMELKEEAEAIKREETGDDEAKLTPVEVVKATYKCYIPTAISLTTSIGCTVGALRGKTNQANTYAAAYALKDAALKEYQAKVIDTIGEKKEKTVRDAIAKDHIDNNPVSTREVIITGSGKTLCFDVFSKRYFESDMETLRRIINDLNKRMLDEMFVTVADLQYEIGLTPSANSEDLGWHVDNGLIDIHFSSHVTDDGRTALVMEYYVEPRYM